MDQNTETSSGYLLRQAREAQDISVQELARDLQISTDFVVSLEEDNYDIFSAKIYARGFLQKIIERLDLKNSAELLRIFDNQWNDKKKLFLKVKDHKSVSTSFKYARFVTVGMVFLFLLVFFGWSISRFILPPQLDVELPRDKMLLDKPKIEVRGSVQKESKLTVNGREINTDSNGHFASDVQLTKGLNTLEFYVQSRFGKSNKVIRYVVVNSVSENN